MRLDKVHEQEVAQRKGNTGRTILQLIWLTINFAAAYFVVEWLLAEKYISLNRLYNGGIPRTVPEWVLQGALMFIGVIIIQFFFIMGYMVASPVGRRRSGRPTLRSWNPDPNDDQRPH